ncbi:hypothetical protein D3C73_1288180 [compost metagenome]
MAAGDHVQAVFTNGVQAPLPMAEQRLLLADERLHLGPLDQLIDATLADGLAVQRLPGLQVEAGDGALMFLPQRFAQAIEQIDEGSRVRIAGRRLAPGLLIAIDGRPRVLTFGPQVIMKRRLLLRAEGLLQVFDFGFRVSQSLQTLRPHLI